MRPPLTIRQRSGPAASARTDAGYEGATFGLGAFHGLDVPYMWDRIDDEVAGACFELADRRPSPELATAMHGAWVEFVRTGVPSHPRLPDWPTYDRERRATMWLDDESRCVDDPLGADRELWTGVRY